MCTHACNITLRNVYVVSKSPAEKAFFQVSEYSKFAVFNTCSKSISRGGKTPDLGQIHLNSI